ncbi:MAG: ABC transporter ATP-binding protein [Planctomycetes bacterium]|nr:ABC transporter ATP-binding protein [Planctomycetota bacterium]
MTTPAIRTVDLTRTYKVPRQATGRPEQGAPPGEFTALDHASVEVQPGELFGLLGTNGAGKTTLIKILTTLLAPTAGSAFVEGLDVVSQAQAIRSRINMVSGGESSGYGILTVRENLWLFSQLYAVPRQEARRRIDAMLEAVGLTAKADTRISYLSTGQRQKMNFCRGFITDPRILFLDEPTLGLDVNAARTIRQYIRGWMAERPGRTLLLTTHYMMEADELCDRIAIIDRGRVLACDTPAALKRRVQRYPIFEMALTSGANGWHDLDRLPGVQQCTFAEGPTSVDLKVTLREEGVVGSVVQEIVNGGSQILSLKKVEPTLEDVFVEMVGHGLMTQGVDA